MAIPTIRNTLKIYVSKEVEYIYTVFSDENISRADMIALAEMDEDAWVEKDSEVHNVTYDGVKHDNTTEDH